MKNKKKENLTDIQFLTSENQEGFFIYVMK